MPEEVELVQKREELKRQLDAGEYKTLIDIFFDGTGRIIQKLTRKLDPPSFWVSAVVIILSTYLIGLLISILLGENYYEMGQAAGSFVSVEDFLFGTFVGLLGVGVVIIFVVAAKVSFDLVFTTFHNHLLNAIESLADLTDLQHWLTNVFCNVKRLLVLALVIGIPLGFNIVITASINAGVFIGIGLTIANVLVSLEVGMAFAQFLLLYSLPIRLSQHKFKLYAVDPSNSETIGHMSDMFSNIVYILAGAIALGTLLSAFAGNRASPDLFFFVLVGWVPLAVFFVISQISLTKIIIKAKWKILNEIQAEVETLQTPENLVNKEMMEAVNRLMDYHDRIKATRNSALDLRAGLNFLNSLLLPLLAFVLANLSDVLSFFGL
jgi:hypothetical protein